MSKRARIILKSAVWGIALSPLLLLLYRVFTNGLGANPISYTTNLLGDTTLRLLLASLAPTPLRIVFGIGWQMSLRRLLGLFAFFYVCLHFTVWIAVDHFFEWGELIPDIVKRPYITVGMLALTLLMPLAATSTSGMVKRLGGRSWRRLHRLVYLIGLLGVLHYLWLVKKGVNDPYLYAAILAVLLGVRLWDWMRSQGWLGLPAWLRGGHWLTGTADEMRGN
ncbi:sulfite oxidase [Candidatus Methylomirabilis lanthanidiphila]|uniref:Protein-methionine-sulfoxide reductase heme-binding subunit MsrQ n=1 Tax=Candidatus Methylomirabilis lanthanidiphila TaxID=2211376 RepID=A0A564ZHS2_9BACT|nr:sulfoxide reductase heme-binding subunit YedZ [Candidatus Methylomirabilis lanthanidiphila]VUZ84467.1 sulfite oxidase [Candidatus Methylomirabilis lanthanidiphila]